MASVPHIVTQIVGRCHVGQSNRAVIKYFISRLKRKRRAWTALSRTERRQWMRWIIAAHAADCELYDYVMKGGH